MRRFSRQIAAAAVASSSFAMSTPTSTSQINGPNIALPTKMNGFSSSLATSTFSSSMMGSSNYSQRRCIHMESSDTPNPECLRFFSMELSFLGAGQSMDLPNSGHAYKSPLAELLFGLEGVKALYFADEYMTVTKEPHAGWDVLTSMVGEAVISFAESGVNILSEAGEKEVVVDDSDTEPQLWDDEVILAVKELLASRIRPMLRGDGGNCRFSGFDEGTVFVLLEGACKSCPSSGMTLKNGIERMLMHWIPEVIEVQEVDEDFFYDHQRQEEEAKAEFEAKEAAKNGGAPAAGGEPDVIPPPPPPPPSA